MRIYRPWVPDGFEWVFPLQKSDWKALWSFDVAQLGVSWQPVKVRLGSPREGEACRSAMMPWMGGHVLVLREEATLLVGHALSQWGDLLPLECDQANLFVFRARHFVAGLDERRSEVTRFEDGRIMMINKHVFDPQAIAGLEIFKLSTMPRGSLYLTESMVLLIEAGRHEGTNFRLVWSDESR